MSHTTATSLCKVFRRFLCRLEARGLPQEGLLPRPRKRAGQLREVGTPLAPMALLIMKDLKSCLMRALVRLSS